MRSTDGLEDWWAHSDLDGLLPSAGGSSAAADAGPSSQHGEAPTDGVTALKRRLSSAGSAAASTVPDKRARTGSSSLELGEAVGDEYDFGAFFCEATAPADGAQPVTSALAERWP